MPVIKSAKKKLRKDIQREKRNDSLRVQLSDSLKKFKKSPSEKNYSSTVKVVDKAAKNHIIHANKAARIKSKLSKLLPKKAAAKPAAAAKKVAKKTTK